MELNYEKTRWRSTRWNFFVQDGNKSLTWRRLFPWFISLDTQSSWLKKKNQGDTLHRIPGTSLCTCELWEMWILKGRCTPCHQHPFPYLLSYTYRKEEQSSMMYLPFLTGVADCSITLVLIPLLSDPGRKLLATLAPFALSLPPTSLDLRFQVAWEKRLGGNSAFAFHHIPSVTGSYYIRSHLCKLILKSVKIFLK